MRILLGVAGAAARDGIVDPSEDAGHPGVDAGVVGGGAAVAPRHHADQGVATLYVCGSKKHMVVYLA